jgi:hypothetical protein
VFNEGSDTFKIVGICAGKIKILGIVYKEAVYAIFLGKTDSIKATFMQRSLTTWEEAENYVLDYPRERVEKFSPKSKAVLESPAK